MSTNKLPTRQLGKNGPMVSAIGLGTMGIGAFYGKTDDKAAFDALTYAADRGMTFWDCADIYGTSEETLGQWFTQTNRRSDIFLATKFGAFDPTLDPSTGPTSAPSYIAHAIARSLARLKTDYIDLYYQHRVDARVPIEVVLEALRPFVDAGKIKWLGLSECSINTLRRACAVPGLGQRVVAVQMEYSPFTLDIEKNGFAEAAEELGVSVVAYSPLARGMISGRYRSRTDFDAGDLRLSLPRWSEENFPKNLEVVDKILALAQKYNSTAAQITLAWILAEHPTWIPIPGSRDAARIEENAGGADVRLPPEALREIRAFTENAEVQGERNRTLAWIKAGVAGDCISLEDWKGEDSM